MSLFFTPRTIPDFFSHSNRNSLEHDLFPIGNFQRDLHNVQSAVDKQWKPAVDIKEEDNQFIVEAGEQSSQINAVGSIIDSVFPD
jgi:HSP20 family molecular chaperone IbpA